MKTQFSTQKLSIKSIGFIAIMMALFTINTAYSQTKPSETNANERTIKGLISNEKGPLKDVNIYQKGTRNGVVTNEKGEFTFPAKLKTGDILLISYLGYETQIFEIKSNTTFVNLVLTEDMIEMIGALNTNKPYKSKRKN